MATEHTTRDGLRKTLATLAIGAMVLTACGTSQALSGIGQSDQSDQSDQRTSVVRDPSNPYWSDSAAYASDAWSEQSVIRDPDNPYWQMSSEPAATYAEPVHGPK